MAPATPDSLAIDPAPERPLRVLIATTVLVPDPRTGGEVATDQFKRSLERAGADVVEAGFLRSGQQHPAAVHVVGRRPIESVASRGRSALWLARALVTRNPYSAVKYRSGRWHRTLAAAAPYDVAIIDHAQLGFLLPELRRLAPRVVLCAHNVEHLLYREAAAAANGLPQRLAYVRESRLMRREESRLLHGVDEVWALTRADATALRNLLRPGSDTLVRVTPLPGLAPAAAPGAAVPATPGTIRVLGTWSWPFNRAGMRWLLEDVLPRLPGTVTLEVGGAGGDWIPTGPRVSYLGPVPDALEFLCGAAAIAIPTQSGGGIEIKTLDALATGVPVVGTPTAFRGIDDPPHHAAVAETPADFAAALMRAHTAERAPDEAGAWSRTRRAGFDAAVAAGLRGVDPARAARRNVRSPANALRDA